MRDVEDARRGYNLMLEPLLLIIFIYLFGLLALGRIALRRWRNYRRDRWLWNWTSEALGRPVEDVTAGLGPPSEVYRGTGRTLYEWKSPPAHGLPEGSGLLIVRVVADGSGRVTYATWETRGASL